MESRVLKIANLPSGDYQNIVNTSKLDLEIASLLGSYQFGSSLKTSTINNVNSSLNLTVTGSPVLENVGATFNYLNYFNTGYQDSNNMTFISVCQASALPTVLMGTYNGTATGAQMYQASIAGVPAAITACANNSGGFTDAVRWLAPAVANGWSISGTTLTVSSIVSNGFSSGQTLNSTNTGLLANTKIVSQLNGSTGGVGTYQVDKSQEVSDMGVNYLSGGQIEYGDVIFIASRFGVSSNVKTTIFNNSIKLESQSNSTVAGRTLAGRNILIGGNYATDGFNENNTQLFSAVFNTYLSDSDIQTAYEKVRGFYSLAQISV